MNKIDFFMNKIDLFVSYNKISRFLTAIFCFLEKKFSTFALSYRRRVYWQNFI
jgi:hypothetical protein